MRYYILFFSIVIVIFSSCQKKILISKGEVFKSLSQVTFSKEDDHSPSISNDGTKLLFVSDRDDDLNIFLKTNILSKAVIKKTSHKGNDINPCFSDDGAKFCFASNRNGNYDIFVMNVGRGFAKTQITSSTNDEVLPDWSPKGDVITFSQYSNIDNEWYLWTKNLKTGQLTQICQGIYPKFSIDGKSIFYKKSCKEYYELWKIDIDGENDTQLITGEEWGIGSFNLSPDRNRIIYSTIKGLYGNKYKIDKSDDGLDLWVFDLENGNQIQITTHKGSDFDPCWSSTGSIYFASTRMGKLNIWSFKPTF